MQNSASDLSVPPVALIRIPQILKVMPVSKSKFWLMVQKGEFPKPIKIGRSSFWTVEQVQEFIKNKASKSVSKKLEL